MKQYTHYLQPDVYGSYSGMEEEKNGGWYDSDDVDELLTKLLTKIKEDRKLGEDSAITCMEIESMLEEAKSG